MRAEQADRQEERLRARFGQLRRGPVHDLVVGHLFIGQLDRVGPKDLAAAAGVAAQRPLADDPGTIVVHEIGRARLKWNLLPGAREVVVPSLRFVLAAVGPLETVEDLAGAERAVAVVAKTLGKHHRPRERPGAALRAGSPRRLRPAIYIMVDA